MVILAPRGLIVRLRIISRRFRVANGFGGPSFLRSVLHCYGELSMGRFLLGTTFKAGALKAHLVVSSVAAMRRLWIIFWCHCPWARALFEKVSAAFSVHLNFDFGFYPWLLHAMARKFSPQVSSVWRLVVITMIWMVWDQRNRCIFDGVTAHSSRALVHFWALMREANGCNLGHMMNSTFDLFVLSTFGITGRPPKATSIINIRWQTPPPRYIKVNVDGGANGTPGRLSGGGVYRDIFGVFRGCFAVDHGFGFAFEAELATSFFPLSLLSRSNGFIFGWNPILLRNRQSLVLWRLLSHWHKVRRLMGDMQIVVSHIFREDNASADRLTREPVDRLEWWSQAPDFLIPFIRRDRLSEFYRFTL
ncbi:hypothetical protein ACS0TY_022011 [Phlomoides rotata]